MTEVQKSETTEKLPVEQTKTEVAAVVQKEESPDIKSESNKANWAVFRQERERDRKARMDAEKLAEMKQAEAQALKAAMEALIAKPQQYQQDPQFHVEQTDEEMIDKKVQAALERERHKVNEEKKQRDKAELPGKLESTFRDFNKVCTAENLDYLDYHYPEVSKAFQYMPDGFEKWSSVYQAVKRFVPVEHKEDSRRLEQNNMKPKTTAPQITDTKPQGAPWILTEERKAENRRRMEKERKSF